MFVVIGYRGSLSHCVPESWPSACHGPNRPNGPNGRGELQGLHGSSPRRRAGGASPHATQNTTRGMVAVQPETGRRKPHLTNGGLGLDADTIGACSGSARPAPKRGAPVGPRPRNSGRDGPRVLCCGPGCPAPPPPWACPAASAMFLRSATPTVAQLKGVRPWIGRRY